MMVGWRRNFHSTSLWIEFERSFDRMEIRRFSKGRITDDSVCIDVPDGFHCEGPTMGGEFASNCCAEVCSGQLITRVVDSC